MIFTPKNGTFSINSGVKKGTFSDFGFGFRDDFRVILPTLSKKGLPLPFQRRGTAGHGTTRQQKVPCLASRSLASNNNN